ncbi:MAG TPA: cyclopropane-fatty-acyl-phospholipid synthase family protein [Steroidobacteraceae bacterium]|nr:cyclopropane-fatty-acyl-phospholipid synthase family protein [Steroidobacteraceae bacterium]
MKPSIVPLDLPLSAADSTAAQLIARLARTLLVRQLRKLRHGRLRLIDGPLDQSFGEAGATAPFEATVRVRDARFYGEVLFAGTLGAGESYTAGRWECDDLTALVRLMVANRTLLEHVDSGWSRLRAPLFKLGHWLNDNDRAGSRRNIAAHYDLGNRFFELFLDETMAYSCAIFPTPQTPLREASIAKFDAALSKLALTPSQHLLEIGTGWGGLALHAARHYGCRVTTTTISREQFDLTRERIARAGLSHRITLLLEDYRDLKGRYDALVSIEMVEAVGHRYLDTYLAKCSDLLDSSGVMLLQSITIRDQLYEYALRSVDFIKRCIFPGSFIPSVQALVDALARVTDLKLFHLEDIGPHYARTLRLWRERLLARAAEVRSQGYPERLLRLWEFYLSYCEGGFEERQLGDVQMLLVKPRSRRASLATIHAAPA